MRLSVALSGFAQAVRFAVSLLRPIPFLAFTHDPHDPHPSHLPTRIQYWTHHHHLSIPLSCSPHAPLPISQTLNHFWASYTSPSLPNHLPHVSTSTSPIHHLHSPLQSMFLPPLTGASVVCAEPAPVHRALQQRNL